MSYSQVGLVAFRDPVTGAPINPTIPLYVRDDAPCPTGFTPDETKLNMEIAGIFADKFAAYIKGTNKR